MQPRLDSIKAASATISNIGLTPKKKPVRPDWPNGHDGSHVSGIMTSPESWFVSNLMKFIDQCLKMTRLA